MKWLLACAILFLITIIGTFIFMYYGSSHIAAADKAIVYYIILFPLASAAAILLFKVLRSYGTYVGKYLNHSLELSGPVVIFLLVILGGYYFANNPPATEYNLKILFSIEEDKKIILNGLTWITKGSSQRKYSIVDGGTVIEDVLPGEELTIVPLFDFYKPSKTIFTAPERGQPLKVTMTMNQAAIDRKSFVLTKFRTALRSYINSAENFRILLSSQEQIKAVINGDENAYNQYVSVITSYNNDFDTLYKTKDSFDTEITKFREFDQIDINQFYEKFERVHSLIFRSFNDKFNNKMNRYLKNENAANPDEVSKISLAMSDHMHDNKELFSDFIRDSRIILSQLINLQ